MSLEKFGSHERNAKNMGALLIGGAVLLAAGTAEAMLSIDERRDRTDKAAVITNLRDGEFANLIVPGYHADGRVISKNLDRHLEQTGTTHYAVHPEKGFSIDSIKEEWLKARAADGHLPARIYAMSMGALLLMHILSDDEFRREFGKIDTIVMDSGLSSRRDVNILAKIGMLLAVGLPVTYTSGKFYNYVNGHELKKPIDHDHLRVLPEEAKGHLESSANTSFGAGRAQLLFIIFHEIRKMDLAKVGDEVQNIRYWLPQRDDLFVDDNRPPEEYSESLQRAVEFWRADHIVQGHSKGAEYPQVIVDTLTNINRDDYRIATKQPERKKIHLPNGAAKYLEDPAA